MPPICAACSCHIGAWSMAWLAILMPSIMLTFGCASALRLRSFSSSLRITLKASPMSLNMPIRFVLSVPVVVLAEGPRVGRGVATRRQPRVAGSAPACREHPAAYEERRDPGDQCRDVEAGAGGAGPRRDVRAAARAGPGLHELPEAEREGGEPERHECQADCSSTEPFHGATYMNGFS